MDMAVIIPGVIVIFSVATVLSIFGKGGGEFYVPLLLTLSIPFQVAAGASLLCLIFSGTAMTIVYHTKTKNIDWPLAVALFSTAGSASFLGGFFSGAIPVVYLKLTFAGVLLAAAALMYIKKEAFINEGLHLSKDKCSSIHLWLRSGEEGDYCINVLTVLPLVGLVGFLAGMVGISGGGLIVPILIILSRVPLRTAFSTNSVLVLLTSTTAIIGKSASIGIDFSLALPLASAAFFGAIIGASLSKRINLRHLQKYFIVVLIIAAIWMIYRAFV